MSSDDGTVHESAESDESAGLSRRGLLRGAAGLGAAGLAAGLLVNSAVTPAAAATATAAPATDEPAAPAAAGEPMVAHVRDARTGEVDLYVGTRHVRFTDPQLAARLATAAG